MTHQMLETVVSTAIGLIMNSQPVALARRDARSSSAERTFWTASVAGVEVFAKCAPAGNLVGTELDQYLSDRFSARGHTPRFFGSLAMDQMEVGVWEYVKGTSADFGVYDSAELESLLGLLADIAVCREGAPAPDKLRWATPSIRLVDKILARHKPDDRREMLSMTRGMSRRLEPLLETLTDCPTGLVHNDFRGANVIQRASGTLCIIDWESATRGPVGSSLRVFWKAPRQDEVVRIFATALGRAGMAATPRQLSKTLAIQQALWALDTGIRRQDVDRIRRGLRTLTVMASER